MALQTHYLQGIYQALAASNNIVATGTYVNILDKGGDNSGVADNSAALTTAIASLPANGGTVYFPAGTYKFDSMIRITRSGIRLIGDGPGATNLRSSGASLGPMFSYGVSSTPVTTLTGASLATGSGVSWQVNQTLNRFNLMDCARMAALDGLTAFTVECFVKINSTTGNVVFDCSGGINYDNGSAPAAQLYSWLFIANSGTTRLDAWATFKSAGQKQIIGPVLTPGTVYHVALVYDGTTLSYYVGGVRQGTQAVAGDALSVPWYSESFLGRNSPTDYPENTTSTDSQKDAFIDSIRISDVAAYAGASFTPPTAKLTGFSSTRLLINFDNFSSDNMVLTGTCGAFGAPAPLISRGTINGSINNCSLEQLQLDGGGSNVAISANNFANYFNLFNINIINSYRGWYSINGFNSAYYKVNVVLSQTNANMAKVGFMSFVCGICSLVECQVTGGPIGFYNIDSSIIYHNCSWVTNSLSWYGWAIEGDNAYATTFLYGPEVDSEVSASLLRYSLTAATSSTGQNQVNVIGGTLDGHLTAGRPCVFWGQGAAGTDTLTCYGTKFIAENTATEMIHLQNGNSMYILVDGCQQPSNSPPVRWCNIAGLVKERNLLAYSDKSGTPGNATINLPLGRFAVAAGTSAVTITNNLVGAQSIVKVNRESNDTTLTSFKVVPTSGSFTVTGNANATAATVFSFEV